MNNELNILSQSQWTHNYVENFNNQFNNKQELSLNNKRLCIKNNLLEQIYFISPYIYELFINNHISLNTAKIKATNLYKTFTKNEKKLIAQRVQKLDKIKKYQISQFENYHPIY